jgi:hypothetical protein
MWPTERSEGGKSRGTSTGATCTTRSAGLYRRLTRKLAPLASLCPRSDSCSGCPAAERGYAVGDVTWARARRCVVSRRFCEMCSTPLSATNGGTLCLECSIDNEPTERKRAHPRCHICGEPCMCGQRDPRGRSIHYGCQLTHLRPARRHHGLPGSEIDPETTGTEPGREGTPP